MSTFTWFLVTIGALFTVLVTAATIYALLRYGNASARITEQGVQMTELRGYLEDARERVKDLEDMNRTLTATLQAANDKIRVLQDLASGRAEILDMATRMGQYFAELREGQKTILEAIEVRRGTP